MRLREIAHARSGDKGNISNIGIIARNEADYRFLVAHVTAQRIAAHLAGLVAGPITRYELPTLGALNFVLEGALGGGVTRSLALDAHGKSFSSAVLSLEIDEVEYSNSRKNGETPP